MRRVEEVLSLPVVVLKPACAGLLPVEADLGISVCRKEVLPAFDAPLPTAVIVR
jgi:hypothetical protein